MSGAELESLSFKEFFSVALNEKEIIFTYFGWAGIILRTVNTVITFDIGKKSMSKEILKAISHLDLQFYSHTHWDHFDKTVTRSIFEKTKAPVIAEPRVADELKNILPSGTLFSMQSIDSIKIDKFNIKSVEGTHTRPITLFHVKWDNWSVFHGGDSGYVSLDNYKAEIAFLPTHTQARTLSHENALKMALDLQPEVVVAIHGSVRQMLKFKKLMDQSLPKIKVIIPKVNDSTKITLN
jgi:L-ascorbate metabolism protein UlaG (beta-lactamase superfamily)